MAKDKIHVDFSRRTPDGIEMFYFSNNGDPKKEYTRTRLRQTLRGYPTGTKLSFGSRISEANQRDLRKCIGY